MRAGWLLATWALAGFALGRRPPTAPGRPRLLMVCVCVCVKRRRAHLPAAARPSPHPAPLLLLCAPLFARCAAPAPSPHPLLPVAALWRAAPRCRPFAFDTHRASRHPRPRPPICCAAAPWLGRRAPFLPWEAREGRSPAPPPTPAPECGPRSPPLQRSPPPAAGRAPTAAFPPRLPAAAASSFCATRPRAGTRVGSHGGPGRPPAAAGGRAAACALPPSQPPPCTTLTPCGPHGTRANPTHQPQTSIA